MAAVREAYNIEADIMIWPEQPPAGLNENDIARASGRRLDDVLVVLEHDGERVAERLRRQIEAQWRDVERAAVQLTFGETETGLKVAIDVHGVDGSELDRRQHLRELPDLVAKTIEAQIWDTATVVGQWRLSVQARLVGEANRSGEKHSAAGRRIVGRGLVAATLGLALAGAVWAVLVG